MEIPNFALIWTKLRTMLVKDELSVDASFNGHDNEICCFIGSRYSFTSIRYSAKITS
uniref:Uncharacterized protein n=1 Tax=Parascaris univalens TaxID=6257 RepID=A0A915B2G1_PARUN